MRTIAFRVATIAALLSFTIIASAGAQQIFLPTGVPTSGSISGIYFGDTEGDCCWLSDMGTIQVSPPQDASVLLLDVFVPDFALVDGAQRLYVKIGADPEQTTVPLSAGEHELPFELPQTTPPSQLAVQIRPSYTFVPAQLGMNQDPRHLSILVRAVRFAAQAEAPVLPPDAPPEIVFLRLNKTMVASGEAVMGTVTTSTNVASVEARIASFSIPVPKVGDGRFELHYTVPNLPFFFKGTYDLVIIARNTAGITTRRVVPITLR